MLSFLPMPSILFFFTKHPTTSGKNTYITIYSLAFNSHSKITTTWKINPKENRNGNYIYLGKKKENYIKVRAGTNREKFSRP